MATTPIPHTTMHTQGLHPESHGIVNNYFYDTVLQDKFYIGVQNQNDPKWWLGEPVSQLGNKLLRHRYD
jgi:ectonucleotide pyrophosphatase/phosphodiesterase family protein 1/3